MNLKECALFFSALQSLFPRDDSLQGKIVFNYNDKFFVTGAFYEKKTDSYGNYSWISFEESNAGKRFIKNFKNNYGVSPDEEISLRNNLSEAFSQIKEFATNNEHFAVKEVKDALLDTDFVFSNVRFIKDTRGSDIFEFFDFEKDATFEPVGLLAKPETESKS